MQEGNANSQQGSVSTKAINPQMSRHNGAMSRGHLVGRAIMVCLLAGVTRSALSAPVTFESAITLAVKHSSRVRIAELDLRKAQSNVAVTKDIFIPSVVVGGGLGWTYGITLTVPTIFTVSAQSLVYSNQQRFEIRAAEDELRAAQSTLMDARQRVEEEVAAAYIALDNNQAASGALAELADDARKLLSIVQDRVRAGLDSDLEAKKAQRGVLQVELQQLQLEEDRVSLLSQLSDLTGVPESDLEVAPESIPEIPSAQGDAESKSLMSFSSPANVAAEETQRAKMARAKGQAGYTWRPNVTFFAQYGRVSPINNVTSFYNLHGNYNTANVGVQISFPLLDEVRKAAARASMADATRSSIELNESHLAESANRLKLRRSLRMLSTREALAEVEYSISQDELTAATIQQHQINGSAPLTPKDEQMARMEERHKYLDLLDARLQLQKAKLSVLQLTGQLEPWLHSLEAAPISPSQK